ncbi:hypothetical protein KMW28_03435 [Flammeovirga yaeyamensis]|uniref:Uncharacterized protein n=1 Tax=Flammeovirga yaeyamensis TaxID=367791 RepID=A0AAX1N562_9BACT|nr:hypothetical protein [Flammeovirga yaeyamensis]MBB3701302.1 hypothetical protein [Flammeovirga yaeyamensis]NMF38229.1 hypothetical protein [Flammeovirga yaeyamensis]QWG02640.1 hypothetical protein KMW28_03435 [Flammeovirga yaeyamensis]
MLEYSKIVLNGVKEEKALFRKELIKSMNWLEAKEQAKLKDWVIENFSDLHQDVIEEILYTKYQSAS